jgi:hypothetical protein
MGEERGITVVALIGLAVGVIFAIVLIQKAAKQQNPIPAAEQMQGLNGLE